MDTNDANANTPSTRSNGRDTHKSEALIQYALEILSKAGFASVKFTESGELERVEIFED